MKCPHCGVAFHDNQVVQDLCAERRFSIRVVSIHTECPQCGHVTISLQFRNSGNVTTKTVQAYPRGAIRPVASEVPADIAGEFSEAVVVFADSPKASAALSRRCLQAVLRTAAGVNPGNLADEIQQVLDANTLPSYLAGAIDGVRNIGNFSAHPIKSQHTGAIVDVEPGEAEWSLDTLEGLFDFYYVQPEILKQKRDAMNKKLLEAGKPPMK